MAKITEQEKARNMWIESKTIDAFNKRDAPKRAGLTRRLRDLFYETDKTGPTFLYLMNAAKNINAELDGGALR